VAVIRFAKNESSLSAIVLTGMGKYFSSGADLKNPNFDPESEGRETLMKPAGRFMMSLLSFPKIFAVAVNGPAVGIAVTMLMHADLVHCSDTATFWAPFTRLALVPELCSSVTFLESHGLSKANELLLLGKKIDAQTAYEWNICSKVVSTCDKSGDAFSPINSLANMMCNEIDEKLLSLPLGDKTVEYFVACVKGSRRQRLEQVCREELLKLDERFDSGQVAEAASHITFGSKQKPRSKL
jgi:enoyl-CoA hydratase/carnithine racemase